MRLYRRKAFAKVYGFSTMTSALAFMILLSGCAISNEGAIDYRYLGSDDPNFTTRLRYKYIDPTSVDSNRLIKPGDALVVAITRAFIADFTEWPSPIRLVRGEPANGEIAVVVNAFEEGKGKLDFSPKGLENGRVVFFSDDVQEGQPLNLSNLSTVYGPLKYDGKPFVLDLYIVEFDTPGPQLKKLVANLAELGGTFYPPSAPITGALSTLASALITDHQEDRAYHHTMELRAQGGIGGVPYGVLLAGHYVFVRENNRTHQTDWDKLVLDENTGQLSYKKCPSESRANAQGQCAVTDLTYVVLEFNRADSALEKDIEEMVYSDLVDKLAAGSPEFLKSELPQKALDDLKDRITETQVSSTMLSDLRLIENSDKDEAGARVAVESFIEMWYDPQKSGQVSYKDEQTFLRRLGNRIAHCNTKVPDQQSLNNLMAMLRDRKTKPNSDQLVQLADVLVCK